jgi:hypothetical protein
MGADFGNVPDEKEAPVAIGGQSSGLIQVNVRVLSSTPPGDSELVTIIGSASQPG